ncbi:hypothetical protein BIV57_16920 [Mangrovactinospora gilvigrisea]|uniref:N-acetyltransferase domain-containing protein n=1 Tax=Mangrovactinospora gilvigrisea TaxID=1428644 RepID=A0A1J7BCL2_9ACTN|nr:GNAT family N-acetyltransferase [Mangrovactinospora gilvigrisea]OIV36325.1 hypothetical protein BIV57_16920 [Mangrovactinospora gilvigrisea]
MRTDDPTHIEQTAPRAWPAATAERHPTGWLLRATPDVRNRRANSALPAGPFNTDALAALTAAEAFYAARDLPTTIQIAPAHHHTALDAALDDRGYRREGPTQVLTATTADVLTRTAPGQDLDVTLADHPTPAWLDAFARLGGHATATPARAATEALLARITDPLACASVTLDGAVAGIGLLVAGDGRTGVFCMATDPAHRRRGIATAILRAGAAWAQERDAGRLYLQVTEENAPAQRVYARAGFTLSHRYHYRVATAPRPRPQP